MQEHPWGGEVGCIQGNDRLVHKSDIRGKYALIIKFVADLDFERRK